jgi:GNAT superfamily N-acetyltransferase
MPIRQTSSSGLGAITLAGELLHRVRAADAQAGVWEAADLQWWWRTPRRSDTLDQLFWLDRHGPVAAALLTDWTRTWGLDVIVAPAAPAGLLDQVWSAALARIAEPSFSHVESLARDDDEELTTLLRAAGFTPTGGRGATTWMDAADRPPVPALPDGFRLVDRRGSADRPHPFIARNGPPVEARLREVPLYDPELDLAILAPTGEVAAYALFWLDPVTGVGLLEPMRTEDAWQRRGLARSLLAAGLDRLAGRGATRLKVSFESPAARALYLGSGFQVGAPDTTWVRSLPQEPG